VPGLSEPVEVGVLAPGLRVRPWRHFLAPFDLGARISLHAGLTSHAGRLRPTGLPRPCRPEELALLDGGLADKAPGPAIEVFTSPAGLREHFWSLDPDELPGGPERAGSPHWEGFAQDVHAFLDHVRAPVARQQALILTGLDPAEPPGLWEAGPGRTLLERDRGGLEGSSPADAQAPLSVAHINLGDEPLALVFLNVPLVGLAGLLRAEGGPPLVAANGLELVRAFAERFPRCPLVRLALLPGDGVLVPQRGVAYDLDPAGATDLVLALSVLPGPDAVR